MELDGDEAFEGATLLIVVDEDRGRLPVDLVLEAIAASDDRELVPLRNIGLHPWAFTDLPALTSRVHHHVDAVVAEDAAAAFFVGHRRMHIRWMDVALVAEDRPRRHLRQAAAAVLQAGVVIADDFDRRAEFEVLSLAVPNEERIRLRFTDLARAYNHPVNDFPEARFAVPAGEVLAVEERREAVLGEDGQREGKQEREQWFHGLRVQAISSLIVPLLSPWLSTLTPLRCRRVSQRLHSGVLLPWRATCWPSRMPEPPPAIRVGQLSR